METNKKSTQGSSYFGIQERGSSLKTEIIAGIIIFMAMFYIIPVQGVMMSAGIGLQQHIEGPIDPVIVASIGIITALTAGIASIIMGVYSKSPLALASGMGVNAFVAYTLMAGGMPFAAAMSAVLMSGLIFIVISVTPARQKILGAIPDDLKKAISIGVGLFILFVALVNGGIITTDPSEGTPLMFGDLANPFILLSIFSICITLVL